MHAPRGVVASGVAKCCECDVCCKVLRAPRGQLAEARGMVSRRCDPLASRMPHTPRAAATPPRPRTTASQRPSACVLQIGRHLLLRFSGAAQICVDQHNNVMTTFANEHGEVRESPCSSLPRRESTSTHAHGRCVRPCSSCASSCASSLAYRCAAWHPHAHVASVESSARRLTLCVRGTGGTSDRSREQRAAR